MTAQTLRDDLYDDIDAFLEPEEFAETVNFNGTDVVGSLEQVASQEYNESGSVGYAEPLFKKSYRLFVRESEFAPDMPRTGDRVKVNGLRMVVISCKPEFGVLTVELGCNES